jgi:3-methylcrotonyl-CoA carboxylase alpha subunit/acetyl-CoA/propionyl-CoA carboxylase biotin carboxyl carrier protein
MPGTVLSVAVSEGQQVDAGDVLGILEAMKMELSLPAPVSGTVTAVRAAAGDRVALDAVVFVVTPGRPEDTGTPARSAGSGDGAG